MNKKRTRLQQLEDERDRILNDLDIYRVLEDDEMVNELLEKLSLLNQMIKLAKSN